MTFKDQLQQIDLKNNILFYFHQADKNQIKYGKKWYQNAYNICNEIAEFYSQDVSDVAAILATLSPRVRWKTNIDYTVYFFDIVKNHKTRRNLGLSRQTKYAYNMWDTKHFVPKTIKTYNFWKSIMGNQKSVVVDIWAMRVALNDKNWLKTFKPDHYKIVQNAYVDAANYTEFTPAQLQAITWTTIRGRHN